MRPNKLPEGAISHLVELAELAGRRLDHPVSCGREGGGVVGRMVGERERDRRRHRVR
jgi:hypothetical protein